MQHAGAKFAEPEFAASDLQKVGGECHDQAGEPLCKLWWKIWPSQPPPLGPALLPQGLQSQFRCESSEGPCLHEKVVWLRKSRNRQVMRLFDHVAGARGADRRFNACTGLAGAPSCVQIQLCWRGTP